MAISGRHTSASIPSFFGRRAHSRMTAVTVAHTMGWAPTKARMVKMTMPTMLPMRSNW
ncbi:unannotated protein [freshwater metagenome]|uniref:Unannotated protein n=1 Tax=freshwater metagenome TaxID=449393 RepID=A0A6J7IMH8_9ZZZZ